MPAEAGGRGDPGSAAVAPDPVEGGASQEPRASGDDTPEAGAGSGAGGCERMDPQGEADQPGDAEEREDAAEADDAAEPEDAAELEDAAEPDDAAELEDAGASEDAGESEGDEELEDADFAAIQEVSGAAIPASSMDSVTLPERSRHSADARLHRPRRSAARLPVLVTPVDIPEDAEGRIEIVVVRAGADRDQPAGGGDQPAAEPAGRVRDLLTLGSGWAAVGGLAAVLIIVFVVVELIYR